MSGKIPLRIVGGPHDGAIYEVAAHAELVQIGHRRATNNEEVPAIGTAVYRRRVFVFEDGSKISYLCWSEYTDRQAMCWLLKIPYEE